jgi:hypothetical protein
MARWIQFSMLALRVSYSLARRRHLVIHANVRSTTHLRGIT